LTGIDLLAWTQTLLLDGDLAKAEPKKLRYRLLHVAARITPTARRTRLAIAADWPWANALTSAFSNLAALPPPHRLTPQLTPQPATRRNPAPRRAFGMPTKQRQKPKSYSSNKGYGATLK
jgi:hypothetical protein